MTIKKIPCGGFYYDDETVEFNNGVMKAKGTSPEVTNAIETHGMGWTSEEEVPAINITWDGNTEGLERSTSGNYVKISDLDIPNDQLIGLKYDGAYLDTHEVAQTYEVTQELLDMFIEYGYVNDDYAIVNYFFIVRKDGLIVYDEGFAHKGIYVPDSEEVETYISRIYKEASAEEVVHQIDEKYIPSSGGGGIVVKVTVDPETFVLSADKTLLELGEAFSNGIPVIAKLYAENQLLMSAQCIQCDEPHEVCSMSFGSSMYHSESDSTLSPIIGMRKLDDDEETRTDFWECPFLA